MREFFNPVDICEECVRVVMDVRVRGLIWLHAVPVVLTFLQMLPTNSFCFCSSNVFFFFFFYAGLGASLIRNAPVSLYGRSRTLPPYGIVGPSKVKVSSALEVLLELLFLFRCWEAVKVG